MSIDQYLGLKNTDDFSELENIRPGDQQDIEYVLDFLDEYAWHHGEGPVWLTGSAQHNSDYGDIDIVVERGSENSSQDYSVEKDHETVYDMLAGIEEIDVDEGQTERDCLIKSGDVDVQTYNHFEPSINRFNFEIDGTEFDLNFNHAPPNDDGIEIVPFYGERRL